MPRKKLWDKHSIKAEVHRRGSTLEAVSILYGLQKDTCATSLNRAFPRGDRALSKFLNVSLHELWPNRYDEGGNRIYSRRKHRRKAFSRASQKSRAPVDTAEAA